MAAHQGYDVEDWKSVEMEPGQIHTHLDSRLRQHLIRTHELLSRDKKAEEMKSHAKILLCSILHKQPSRRQIDPQVIVLFVFVLSVFFVSVFFVSVLFGSVFFFCLSSLSFINPPLDGLIHKFHTKPFAHALQPTPDDGQDSPEETSTGEAPLTKREVRKSAKAIFGGVLPNPPRDFIVWLSEVKGLAKPTVKTYLVETRQFLGFVQQKARRTARLEDAWDVPLCQRFFKAISLIFAPTTVTNYHVTLTIVREFLQLQGRRPANFQDVRETFRLLNKSSRKKKRSHLMSQKVKRASKPSLLAAYYQDVYHNDNFWKKFNCIIRKTKAKIRKGEQVRFRRNEVTFLTSFCLCLVTATNFKRTNNLALMPHEQARFALNNALCSFRQRNPDVSTSSLPRCLDTKNCIPAVIEVPDSAKKGEVEFFCVLNARDQKALLEYEEYVRKNLRPSVSYFFVNRKGKSLSGTAGYYFKWIGRRVGMKDLSVSALRAEMETENFLESEKAAQISAHLGHSKSTAAEYYVSRDKRHAVAASVGMMGILEEHGERAFKDAPPSVWDPVCT